MEEHIHILITKALSNEASAAELQELDMWLNESGEHRSAYASMQSLWQQADTLWQQPQFDEQAAWTKVSAAMQHPAAAEQPARSVPFRRSWLSISAAAAAIVAVVLLYNMWSRDQMITVKATDGLMAVTLPDESKVSLRKGSTLSYPEHFDEKQRNVSLSGEAYFEVTHKEEQPFVVDASSVSVTVLGTTFFVSGSEQTASVTVTSGKVRMAEKKAPQHNVILLPGNKGVYTGKGQPLRTEADTNAVYYRTGQLAFAGQSLEQVTSLLSQLKGVPVLLSASLPATARTQAINATFSDETLEDILTELCTITHTRWARTGNRYELYAR